VNKLSKLFDRVVAARVKGMTAKYAAHAHPTAAQSTVSLYGLPRVLGTGWDESARRGE